MCEKEVNVSFFKFRRILKTSSKCEFYPFKLVFINKKFIKSVEFIF